MAGGSLSAKRLPFGISEYTIGTMNRARRVVELLRRGRRLRRREWARPESYRGWVVQRLRRVVSIAATRVPYYRELFARCGVRPDDIAAVQALYGPPRRLRLPAAFSPPPVHPDVTVSKPYRCAMFG